MIGRRRRLGCEYVGAPGRARTLNCGISAKPAAARAASTASTAASGSAAAAAQPASVASRKAWSTRRDAGHRSVHAAANSDCGRAGARSVRGPSLILGKRGQFVAGRGRKKVSGDQPLVELMLTHVTAL
jgi:hypothetical protein